MLPILLSFVLAVQDTSVQHRATARAQRRADAVARQARQAQAADSVRAVAAARDRPDAYADGGASDIVTRARASRDRNERLVTSYQVNVTQRIGVGIRALRRDRMLFGQELAAHIEWQRDGPSRVEVTGARQRIPVALRGDRVPEDLDANVMWLVIDPSADYLRLAGDDADGFVHPLSANAEGDYRYASGDTTTLTLPGGHVLRLLELKVTPRRADFNLMSGSLWFDADSYGLVRAVFAPARPFDIEIDGDSGDADDVPAMMKPIRATVRYVSLEYGLYDLRWWMPRYLATDLEAQMGPIKVPMRFERVYGGYRVQGGAEPVAGARRPAGSVRRQERDTTSDSTRIDADSLGKLIATCVQERVDSAAAQRDRDRAAGRHTLGVRIGQNRFQRECWRKLHQDDRWPTTVVIPADTASLLRGQGLGEPILQMGDVISEDELRQLGREIGAIPQRPWQVRPQLPLGVGAILKNARYNRVEALSLGLNGAIDFGRLSLDGLARIGVADREPNFELGLARPARNARYRLGAYRRLEAANPDTKPFSVLNSFNAFFTQRDDGEYYRTLGVELTGANSNAGWWSWRIYGQEERQALVHTNVGLPHLFHSASGFRPNIYAGAARQVGASLALRGTRVLGRNVLVGVEGTVDGASGTFDFARTTGTVRGTITGVGPLAIGLEGAAGTSAGPVPVQSLFYLGGPATLRGYTGGAMAGPSFWRGRIEAATQLPVARLAVFSDVGWAGARTAFSSGRPMWGVGVGASFLDGIIRLDLARRLRAPQAWRFDFYLDGIL